MGRELGYVSPLLSSLAVDHAKEVRKGLIASILFPRISVGKPSGKMRDYATSRYGIKSFIDKADLEFMDGPFKLWERRKTESLVGKLELAQEKRVADTVLALSGRSTTLSGTGTTKTNLWGSASRSTGGNPYEAIKEAIGKLFYRPNLMILPESVYDAIEYHPRLIDKLGEANLIRKVDEANLAKLFRIDRVIIAKGKADFSKRRSDESVSVSSIW
jgi:hypothetical protein